MKNGQCVFDFECLNFQLRGYKGMGNKRLANGNLELEWERFGISNKIKMKM